MGIKKVENTPKVDLNLGSYGLNSSKVEQPKLGIFGFGYASNSIKTKSQKEMLYEKISSIKDPEVRKQVEESFLTGTPSQQFVDYLIKKYDKKQAEFEQAWAEYQASKNSLNFYKKTLEIIEKKYENSDSNYELGLVSQADKNKTNAERRSDILLSKASDIAHKPIG